MELAVRRSNSGALAWLVAAALVFAVGAYFSGLIKTLGYESRHITFSGLASGTSSGGGFGLKGMVFLEGQTFFADYQVEIRKGSLRIGILKTFGPIGSKPHFVESITEDGSGHVSYRIPETGLYSIYFDGSVLGDGQDGGYDLSYSVHWGAH